MKTDQVAQRFAQAQSSYEQHAIAQRRVTIELLQDMRSHVPPHLQRILEIGCGSGLFTRQLLQHYSFDQLFLNDLYPEVKQHFEEDAQIYWGIGNVETLPLPQSLDLVVSCSALQWVQQLEALLVKIHQALNPSGWLCFASYAQDNLKEIKALTGQGLEYRSLSQIVELLESCGYEVLMQEEQHLILEFEHPRDVLKHIKATGVQATAAGFRWNKSSLQLFYEQYQQFQLPDSQQYPLTYHPIYLIARKHP
ncbi:malonyl-ACP O-methyltransferase BioC [Acinetobacter sp. ASP199]|uniref:malonyl-ACP O-methyltransferase BioC n=1 Tax=unclassified Acinetobacter TaxID=196816 RepID=UPI001F61DA58|nr:malonyl-ACP O-methyltransferase BioC [Acinetobacter sp. ASP199]UNT59908.1 malonyl-ACP O-methyltransferase BioC [Acinetobacter sp. ASP199]